MNDFSTTIKVKESPETVYNAITNVKGWWSEEVEGKAVNVGDEYFYHYKDVHLCKVRVIEAIPNKRIVWQVLENQFSFVKDQSEWKDTKIMFDISEMNGETTLKFTHVGLTQQYECYDICHEAWTNYVQNSLYKLITTGKGEPNPKDGEGYNTELAKKWHVEPVP